MGAYIMLAGTISHGALKFQWSTVDLSPEVNEQPLPTDILALCGGFRG